MADQSKEIVACGHFTIKTKLNKLNIPTFGKNKKGTSRSVTWLVALRPSDQNHFPKLPVECSNSKNMWFLYSDWCFLLCERVAGRLLWSWVKLLLFAGGNCGFERRRTQSRAWERAAGLFRNRSLSDAAESSTIYLRMSKNTPHLSVCAFISVVHSRRRRRRSFRKKEEMSPKVRKLLLKLSVTLSADWLTVLWLQHHKVSDISTLLIHASRTTREVSVCKDHLAEVNQKHLFPIEPAFCSNL